jgi:hypothetical protein
MVNFISKSAVIAAIAEVAGMIDFILFGGETKNESSNLTYAEKHPLIGRRMIVKDNSYIIDKETGLDCGLYDKEVVIVSDPYRETVHSRFVGDHEHLFVDVASLDSGRRYRVLFNEDWLIDENIAPKVEVEDEEDDYEVKPRGYWNEDTITRESRKYPSRIAFKHGSRGAYDAALRLGMMDDLYPKY